MRHDTHAPPLSLREIRAIVAVSHQRSFSRAADALNMSQSNLSRAVNSAEAALGKAIFQRGWSGAEPTPEGEIACRICARVVDELILEREALLNAGLTKTPLPLDLSWANLDCVAAIANTGSATAAAELLTTSQSHVSRTIGALATRTGIPLFQRTGGSMQPQPLALKLVALRNRLRSHVLPLMEQLGRLAGEVTGRVAVGMTPFCEQERVAQAFGELLTTYPKLHLSALTGSYVMLTEALRRGEIDLVMGLLRELDPSHALAELPLFEEEFSVLARSDHPCAHGPVTIEELAQQTWIVAPTGTPIRAYFERLFLQLGQTPPVQTCEMVTFHLAERMVRESQSLALLLYSAQRARTLPPGLVRVNVTLPDSKRRIGITYRRSSGLSFAQQTFVDYLKSRTS